MSDFVTALTGAGTAMAVGIVAMARASAPSGQHRKPPLRAVLDEASLEELLGPWPEPVCGAAVARAWADCPSCRKATAGVLHKDGWMCGECLGGATGGAS